MAQPAVSTRQATAADLDAICRVVEAGFESYRDFLPVGWEPPPYGEERRTIATRLADPGTWKLVACADGEVVGHVGFRQAVERHAGDPPAGPEPPPVPGMAHLWQLFVLPAWWGGGVADLLHRLGIVAMNEQGYGMARLFTPALHERARRFYERRGWQAVDEAFNEYLGIDMVECRRELRKGAG